MSLTITKPGEPGRIEIHEGFKMGMMERDAAAFKAGIDPSQLLTIRLKRGEDHDIWVSWTDIAPYVAPAIATYFGQALSQARTEETSHGT